MALLATLFALFCFIYSSDAVSKGALRFVRNGVPTINQGWSAGIVQVYWNGTWGNICYDDGFGDAEADVICRQLGYTGSSSYSSAGDSTYGTDSASTILKDLSCSGGYLTITQCAWSVSSGSSGSCGDDNDVAVVCQSTRIWNDPTSGDIRLTSGSYSNQGLLEIYCNDEWGTVCDDTFYSNQATVACRQLGYNSYSDYDHLSIITGKSSQKIWLDSLSSLSCSSSSSCLTSCESCPSYEDTVCSHSEDVTLECEYDDTKDKVETDADDSCDTDLDLAEQSTGAIVDTIMVICIVIPICICIVIYLGIRVGCAFKKSSRSNTVATTQQPSHTTTATVANTSQQQQTEGSYPAQSYSMQSYYPPRQGGYPGSYPTQQGGYPPDQQSDYPHQQWGYPPDQQCSYSPQQGGYSPDQHGGYPPQQGDYPPPPPQQWGYPPQQDGDPPPPYTP